MAAELVLQDYTDLFDVTAEISQYDPASGALSVRPGDDSRDRWSEIRYNFIFARGYTAVEFRALCRMIGEDVLTMHEQLAAMTPEDFR